MNIPCWIGTTFDLFWKPPAKVGSAARVLGVNHATVARRITAAEKALGARLFDRLSTGYVPTEAGQQAVLHAQTMEQIGSDLELQIGARDTQMAGDLVVTAPQLLIERILGGILKEFISAHPGIRLRLAASNTLLNLSRREADVAFRVSAQPSDTLIGLRVCDQKATVYATPEQIARDKDGGQPLDWIHFTSWQTPLKDIQAIRPDLNTCLEVDDMYAAISAARSGIGATRMACFMGDADPMLQRVPGFPLFEYAPLWVLTHPDLRQVPRIRAFVDFATARLRQARPLFLGRADRD